MKFKQPTSKSIISVGTQVAAIELGRRISNGVVTLIPADKKSAATLGRLGIAAAAVVAAAAYKGKHKDLVQLACAGMAVEQSGKELDRVMRGLINKKAPADTNQVDRAIYAVAGLNGPCGCGDGDVQHQIHYPVLNAPQVEHFYTPPVAESADYEEVETTLV